MTPSINDVNSEEDLAMVEAKIKKDRTTFWITKNRFGREIAVNLETYKTMQLNQDLYKEDGINASNFIPMVTFVTAKINDIKPIVNRLVATIKKNLSNNADVFAEVMALHKKATDLIVNNKFKYENFDLGVFDKAFEKLDANAEKLAQLEKAKEEAKKN